MLPQYAETLRLHIERSPFSEEVVIRSDPDSGHDWIIDGSAIEWETIFDGGNAGTTMSDYRYFLEGNLSGGGGIAVRGIFDESVERDEGNKATRRKPRVIVFAWPREARAGTRVAVRGREYAVTSYEADANLGMVVWLR